MTRPSLSASEVSALDNRDGRRWSILLKVGFVFALTVGLAAIVKLALLVLL